MQSHSILSTPCAAFAAVILTTSGNAAELATEPFDYPGSLSAGLSGTSGGTGWSGAWTDTDSLPTIASTNLSLEYPTGVLLAESGGRIEVTVDATNNPAGRLFSTPMSLALSGQTFYSSALFRRSSVTGELSSVLFDRSSDNVTRWYYGIDINGFFSTAVDPSNVSQRTTSTFQAATDTTYLLVSKFRTNTAAGGNDEVFLQIFEEGELIAEPALDAAWDLRAVGGSSVMLDRFRLAMSNAAGQTNAFDEFRVGTTFADVTGVPEPGSLSLLGIGSLALLRRRRK